MPGRHPPIVRRLILKCLVGLGLVASATLEASIAADAAVCTAPPAPAPGSAFTNINTTTENCDDTRGNATDPATGFIAITMPSGITTATVTDAFQGLSEEGQPDLFFIGQYTIRLSRCTGGTATGGSYTTVASTGAYPGSPSGSQPPAIFSGGTLPTVIAEMAGGTVICAYVITVNSTAPSETITSVRNDLWINFIGDGTTAIASVSVKPFGFSPVPEAPQPILLPLAALAIFGSAFLLMSRRARHANSI